MKRKIEFLFSLLIFLIFFLFSCKKFIEVDSPSTSINSLNIYQKDVTATSVLTGIYTSLSLADIRGEVLPGLSYYTGLSSDELRLLSGLGDATTNAFYSNTLNSRNVGQIGGGFWNNIYSQIYILNDAIQGISNSKTLSIVVKQQLLGEAMFMRAFCFFYLVNLYGDVPLVLTTDYKLNTSMSRSPKDQVWDQIVEDLKEAQELLSTNYLDGTLLKVTSERVRPTKYVAAALLARAYLYKEEWKQAQEQADFVLNNNNYRLVTLNEVFNMNNTEAIWQLQPVSYNNPLEGVGFLYDPLRGIASTPVVLSESLLSSFDSGDERKVSWIKSLSVDGEEYNFPYKYKFGIDPSIATSQYSTIFRLAEQYLIRAEAKIQLGDVSGGIEDLNILRDRATNKTLPQDQQLKLLPLNLSKENALLAVEHERQVELFTEWGHRWLDLKRTGRIDDVMKVEVPKKRQNGTWNSFQQLYPVWYIDIQRGSNLVQNEGY